MSHTGTWSNDPQHIDIMGSPYLLATGLGKPVDDAHTIVTVPSAGSYRLWVRCRDWLPSHSPGRFQVLVNGKASGTEFGTADNDEWRWVDGGDFELAKGKVELRLHDTSGWWSRCDTIVLARGDFTPASAREALIKQRIKYAGVSPEIGDAGRYDFVVVGGGPAGMAAAIAAARHGLHVALIQDRPVYGGNASPEIEIPPMGYIGSPPDTKSITGITEELFTKSQSWSATLTAEWYKKIIDAEANISQFLNTRGIDAEMDDRRITAVIGQHVVTGERLRFKAALVADTTGHGWIGYYAGADYKMGQDAKSEFDESMAPDEANPYTMGNSIYKAVFEQHDTRVPFECPEWAYHWTKDTDFEPRGSHIRETGIVRPANFDPPARGKGRNPGDDINGNISSAWWVEYGGMKDTITDAEHIRDELLRISLGLWNYAKNVNPKTKELNSGRQLVWLNYVPGVRESRRLLGDYIMTQKDYDTQEVHHDTVAFTDWGPDLHHPQAFWVKGNDCIHVYKGRRTSIPYRTLYSRNIDNLFMAGRNHSASQLAMAGTRVMRPCAAMGQAVGTAAAIAVKHSTTPRGVYKSHIKELQETLVVDGCRLMKQGGAMIEPDSVKLPGVVVDDTQATVEGEWIKGIYAPACGDSYIHDDNKLKGRKSVQFKIAVDEPGRYKVILHYSPGSNRATNVPVTVTTDNGEPETFTVNQKTLPSEGKMLGLFDINRKATVTINTHGTDNYVIADGVQLLKQP